MDRVDDLGVVNPLEVDAGDPQIAMAELSLDVTSGTPSCASSIACECLN
jgi:hypothetical protein